MAAGEVLRRTVGVTLKWGDPEHFDRSQSLPCRMGDGPTRMRDDHGKPCHLQCAEQELARVITAERFGNAEELARESTGFPLPVVAGQRTPLAPEGRR